MGNKNAQGTGAAFKVEQNPGMRKPAGGAAASLSSYGSLGDCVECVVSAGCYISFGRTSDGGATLIRVLDGDTKLSSYCTSGAEVLEAMEYLKTRYKRKELRVVPNDGA